MQRAEIITIERRRRWSLSEKQEIVAATLEPGASVAPTKTPCDTCVHFSVSRAETLGTGMIDLHVRSKPKLSRIRLQP